MQCHDAPHCDSLMVNLMLLQQRSMHDAASSHFDSQDCESTVAQTIDAKAMTVRHVLDSSDVQSYRATDDSTGLPLVQSHDALDC